jgi:hypothetical protein
MSFTRCFMGQILGMFGFTNIHFGNVHQHNTTCLKNKKVIA